MHIIFRCSLVNILLLKRTCIFMSLVLLLFFSINADCSQSKIMENPGFLRKIPQALKLKFPMCNAFLDVKWIDKTKKIGYSSYDAFLFGDGNTKKAKVNIFALVYLDDFRPSYTLDIYQYKKQNRMNELFEIVKNGTAIRNGVRFEIKYKGGVIDFYGHISPVLSGHSQTICIAYPDASKAWIIEGKAVTNAYTDEQRKEIFNRISQIDKNIDPKKLDSEWILDINFDGKDDYVPDVIYESIGMIVYSWSDKLY